MKPSKFSLLSTSIAIVAFLTGCASDVGSLKTASPHNKPVIVIDPGHGTGNNDKNLDGSAPNNAKFYSAKLKRKIEERELTLEVARQVADFVNQSGKAKAVLTKTGKENIGMQTRANVAIRNKAYAFVSIHFNSAEDDNGKIKDLRGPVAIVQGLKYTKKPVNTPDQLIRDNAFGDGLAKAVASVTRQHDPMSVAKESQIFDKKDEGSWLFRYLRESDVGKTMNACFLEIEFMDNPAVAAWLLESDNSTGVRTAIAKAIANRLVEDVTNR